jgi:hypothetical protein
MVKKLESSILKDMTLSDLKKHAKKLRKDGYQISGYSKLSDTPSDISTLRKMIRRAQKAGKSNGSSLKLPSPTKKSGCNPGFDNVTHCVKKSSAKKIKELADECGIEYTTKEKTCRVLLSQQGKGGSKKKSVSKTPSSGIVESEAYKKLNKMKKKDNDGPDLHDIAKKLKITYAQQDGENISIGKLRKKELIVAILKKKKIKVPPKQKTPSPPRKKSKKKSKKRTPSPPRKKSKKKSKDKRHQDDLPDHWSVEGLARKTLINKVSLATGRSKSFYKLWNTQELRDRLEGMEIEQERTLEQSNEQSKLDELEARRIMINRIIALTGEDPSVYKSYTLDDVMDKLNTLEQSNEQSKLDELEARRITTNRIIALTGEDPSVYKSYTFDDVMNKLNTLQDDESPTPPKKRKKKPPKKKTPTPDVSSDDESSASPTPTPKKKTPTPDESSDDESSDDESSASPTPPPKKKKKKPPTPVSSSDDDSSESSSDRPDEGAEIGGVESTLANVIAGNKKIGELAKVQKSILKCMGLLS